MRIQTTIANRTRTPLATTGGSGFTLALSTGSIATQQLRDKAAVGESTITTSFDLQQKLQETQAAAASWAGKLASGEFVPNQVLVRYGSELDAAGLQGLARDYGAKIVKHYDLPKEMNLEGSLALLQLDELSTAQALGALENDGRVSYVEANDLVEAASIPNDWDASLWHLEKIKAPAAWAISQGSRENGPIVAILDTGADITHNDLANNLWTNPDEIPDDGIDNDGNGIIDDVHGANFINNSNDVADPNGHGTHCAGLIGAEGNNLRGIPGLNWEARLMPLKFMGGGRSGSIADAIEAMVYATDKGARITSNSWTATRHNQALEEIMRASPALHICAAGDNGENNDSIAMYPANFKMPNLISVAATDSDDKLALFSNRGGNSVHLAAPGTGIWSLAPENELTTLSGTSQAAPLVTGTAALIAARYPEADNATIKNRILHGVDPLPRYEDRLISGGRLNAATALEIDNTAPAAPPEFEVVETTNDSVKLAWLAPGDDGLNGQAVSYDIRYAYQPIVTQEPGPGEIAFNDAIPVSAPEPKPSGEVESVQLELPPSGQERELYFAVQAIDNVGNRSEAIHAIGHVPARPVLFEDNVDGADTVWAAEGNWARVESLGRGLVWSDSPDSDYGPNRNDTLTSPTISLKEAKDTSLRFDARIDTEAGYDRCHVEVYGKRFWRTRWRTVESLDGLSDWKNIKVDLSAYDGQDIKVRFRFESDETRHRYGVELDNIVVLSEDSTS